MKNQAFFAEELDIIGFALYNIAVEEICNTARRVPREKDEVVYAILQHPVG